MAANIVEFCLHPEIEAWEAIGEYCIKLKCRQCGVSTSITRRMLLEMPSRRRDAYDRIIMTPTVVEVEKRLAIFGEQWIDQLMEMLYHKEEEKEG